jgi:hypothetical protein
MTFGDWLLDEALPSRGIGVMEFAGRLGTYTSTIYRWRDHPPRRNMVGRVARELGLSYPELAAMIPRRSEAMSKQQLTVTYVSPGGEEVDWWTQATGPDDAAAIEKCLKQFRQAHVAGLKITELRVQDMSGDRLVS